MRESLSSLMRAVGYTVEDFDSAESFLGKGKWNTTTCLILDLRLPGMSGLDLQRRLSESGRPPIVFISGHATDKDKRWAMQKGAIAFLRKPFSDEALLDAVAQCVARGPTETPILFNFLGEPAL